MFLDESHNNSRYINNQSFLNEASRDNISMLSQGSKARIKLNYMSQLKSCESKELIEYKKQLKYFAKASLYDINDGMSKNKRKTY
jgi:hypothetical protein